MDKNAIKKYAVWARTELIERVTQRAEKYDVNKGADANVDSVHGHLLISNEKKQRQALLQKVNEKGFDQVMEEVAYTWFNRFAALRFMEVNGYLPSHVRVFTDDDNNFKPQILAEAIHLDIDGLDMEKVYAYKDANQTEELYKYLLITQCNALSKILPGMFQKISDYTELLFPDNLLREGSAIEQMISLISEDDWKDQIQIVGWLYQYYNTEPKDKVFADLKKNVKITKEKIPAATQLFTPDWIVRYMVENSLGRLWAEGHPGTPIKSEWKYYLEEAEQEPDVQKQLAEIRKEYAAFKPEDIRVIDPCSGSGHILAYMFDVLVQIYGDYGIPARDAVRSIIENNLWGLDIDERAAQLAYFSVMMKGTQYDRRFLRRNDDNGNPDIPQPYVYAIRESNHLDSYAVEQFVNGDAGLKKDMDTLIAELYDAKEYGSILTVSQVNFDALYRRFDECKTEISMYQTVIEQDLYPFVQTAQALSQKYHAVVTNPPYMGGGNMSALISSYLKNYYPESKLDFCTVFLQRTIEFAEENGKVGLIILPVWMFLSSYEKLRDNLLEHNTLINMLHFGRGVFGSDFGSVAFAVSKKHIDNYIAQYKKLFEAQGSVDTIEVKEKMFFKSKYLYTQKQENFFKIPGHPIAYWATPTMIDSFSVGKPLGDVSRPRIGQNTGDNDRFLRLWFEVSYKNITFDLRNEEMTTRKYKWLPYNKGGSYRKWFGNQEYIINWENDGKEIKDYAVIRNKGKHWSRYIQNIENMCREGVTWTFISSSKFGTRYLPTGFICDVNGSAIFPEHKDVLPMLSMLNTNLTFELLKIENSTMSFQACNIAGIPYSKELAKDAYLSELASECVRIAKEEWDSYETSWNFQKHPLIADSLNQDSIVEAFKGWSNIAINRVARMQKLEEKINANINQIYNTVDEITPFVDDGEITLRRPDAKTDISSFISYAVGCMFGRYSLDQDGIVFAGGQWVVSKYETFPVDKDGILPVCDDEYFNDDITNQFVRFVENVYGKAKLEENLRFIADSLGGKGSPREVIRNYFLNDFYRDHCKTYQKRPIYWLFDSGKKNGFKCLIYMHRYQPDTIARIRTDFVHEQQARYRTVIADLEQRINGASTNERVKLNKQLTKLQGQADEIRVFEEKVHHLADQMISIDLDDGVKYNYEIFKDVLAKIK